MSEVMIVGIIITALLFVYGIVRSLIDFKLLRDSIKQENLDE